MFQGKHWTFLWNCTPQSGVAGRAKADLSRDRQGLVRSLAPEADRTRLFLHQRFRADAILGVDEAGRPAPEP